jgi:hypothetical protein
MSKPYEYDDNRTLGVDENIPIRITEGNYKGLTYRYGKINFTEEGEVLRCNFNYDILENPNNITEDQELVDFLGEIVIDVLEDEMKEIGDDFLRSGEVREEREVN